MISQLFKTKSFEGQLPDEKTALVLRMHWFVLLSLFFGWLLLFLLPVAVYELIRPSLTTNNAFFGFWFLTLVYLLLCWGGLFYRLALYVLTVWVVTDHRVLANEQHALFHRSLAELTIVKVQDVEVEVRGFIGTLLDFGDVQIQSAGEEENFRFRKVPHPAVVKDVIIKAQRHFLSQHPNNQEPDGV